MPIFEYMCPECGATLERVEIRPEPEPLCLSCMDATMAKMASLPAVMFGFKRINRAKSLKKLRAEGKVGDDFKIAG